MEEVDRIIFECVDSALSSFDFVDKKAFYNLLETTYGVKPTDIGQNLDIFANVLKEFFGGNSYKIQTRIVQIMHEGAKNGKYTQTDEIQAFLKVTQPFTKIIEANIRRAKELTNLNRFVEELQRKVAVYDERLKASERLAAIGATAGMVGHDIRNPLQAMTGDLYLLNEEVKDMPDGGKKLAMQESLSSMQENIGYVDKIVQDLQDYAKVLTPECKLVDLSDVIANIFQTIAIPNDIKLLINIQKDLAVNTDPAYIRRALTNLVTNAVQAMPKGGTLSLSASKTNKRLYIIISDTGQGIPKNVKEKIFTPLVTSKLKGQGLGLAVVKRLVEALDGTISFESEEGKGTKFIVELPTDQ